MEITIYSADGLQLASVVVGSNSYEFTKIQDENYLQLEFQHGEYINLRRNAYVIYNNVKYTLIDSPVVEKVSTVQYNYSARFQSPQELLKNIIMTHMAGEGQTSTKAYERNFSLMATAKEHIDMMILNTAKLPITFVRGSVSSILTGEKLVAYDVVDCKSALQLIANAYETEWWVDGNETDGYRINLGKCSHTENRRTYIGYGYDQGVLPNMKRLLHQDAQRMTHICVQGGTQNINTLSQLEGLAPYQFNTLHLPALENRDENGVGTIYYDVASNKFDGETGFSMNSAVLLTIDRKSNTMTSSLYNEDTDVVLERAYDLSEFYPKKVCKVSTFGLQNNNTEFYITDSTIENACNYNTYQLGGEKITIVFQTGVMAGKTFDVIKYDHTNRKFICQCAEYDTITMPSATVEMWTVAKNDEFIVYGTALPKSYFADISGDTFTGAEWDMARRTASILCENFEDKYAYSVTIDSNWLSRRTETERNRLKCGYWVHFSDNQLCGGGVNLRITAVKTYLTHPLNPEITIGDEVKTISIAQQLTQIQSNVSATTNTVNDVQSQVQQVQTSQVQADWDETDETSKAFILNKPTVLDGEDGNMIWQSNGHMYENSNSYRFAISGLSPKSEERTPQIGDLVIYDKYYYLVDSIDPDFIEGGVAVCNNRYVFRVDGKNGKDGKDGKDGSGVSILGSYNTVAELTSAHPTGENGDAYIVGLDLYVWDGSAWKNVGQIKGQDGKDAVDIIDTAWADSQSDEHVPSSKLVKSSLDLLVSAISLTNTNVDNCAKKTDLNNYVTTDYLGTNYYNKAFLNVVLEGLKDDIPTSATVAGWGFVKRPSFATSSTGNDDEKGKWKEIAVWSIASNTTVSHSQVFSVTNNIVANDKHFGILSVSVRVQNGQATHLTLNVDNPTLASMFIAVFNDNKLSIYAKQIANNWGNTWNGWKITTISDSNQFTQGADTAITEPTAGTKVVASCYIPLITESTVTNWGFAKTSAIPTVPTNVSAFTNDAGYLTQHQSLANYALKSEIPTVPTKVSAFTNDKGYLTEHQSLANYALKSEIPTSATVENWGFLKRKFSIEKVTYDGTTWTSGTSFQNGISNFITIDDGSDNGTARIFVSNLANTQSAYEDFLLRHSMSLSFLYYENGIMKSRVLNNDSWYVSITNSNYCIEGKWDVTITNPHKHDAKCYYRYIADKL